jgi:hypothetical protein
MTTPEHLIDLLKLQDSEILRYLTFIQDIVDLRKRHFTQDPLPIKAVDASHEPPATQLHSLIQRKPMRPPTPGSLRATVHEVLQKQRRPMKRADVIDAVSRARGIPVDPLLKAKVADALSNQHDSAIQKVAQGIYQAIPKQEIPCI